MAEKLRVDIEVNDNGASEQIGKVGKGVQNLSKNARNSTIFIQNFSEGLGDMQYGLRNVGNNIEIMAGRFTELVRDTGSAKNAFKSLATSLVSPVGLLGAFTLLINFGPQIIDFFFGVSEEAKKAKKEIEDLKVANDQLYESLLAAKVSKSQKLVANQAKLVSELRQEYLKLQNGLKDIQVYDPRTGNFSNAYQNQKKLISQKEEELRLEGSKLNKYIKLNDERQKEARLQKEITSSKSNKKRTSANVDRELEDLLYSDDRLAEESKIVSQNIAKVLKYGVPKGIEDAAKELKNSSNRTIIDPKDVLVFDEAEMEDLALDAIQSAIDNASSKVEPKPLTLGGPGLFTHGWVSGVVGDLQDGASEIKEEANKIGQSLQAALGSAFTNIGKAIGDALVSGFEPGTFMTLLGSFMQQFGAALIAIGVAELALKFAAGNPWAAIAAGVALVAAGTALSSARKSNPAGSGASTGNYANQASNRITPQSIQGGGGFQGGLVSTVRGQDLRFVLQGANDSYSARN